MTSQPRGVLENDSCQLLDYSSVNNVQSREQKGEETGSHGIGKVEKFQEYREVSRMTLRSREKLYSDDDGVDRYWPILSTELNDFFSKLSLLSIAVEDDVPFRTESKVGLGMKGTLSIGLA